MSRELAVRLRDAGADDVPAITAIYADHVHVGTGTFELDPPDEAEMRRRRDDIVLMQRALGPGDTRSG